MKHYCDSCNQITDSKTITEIQKVNVKGRFFDAELTITRCNICGEEVYVEGQEAKNDYLVLNKYRSLVGLLQSEEIKNIRSKYSLSAKDFGIILGFGEKTITRYENGWVQDQAHDNLIRLMNSDYNMYRLWNQNKESLSEKTNLKLNDLIKPHPSVKTEYGTTQCFVQYVTGIHHEVSK